MCVEMHWHLKFRYFYRSDQFVNIELQIYYISNQSSTIWITFSLNTFLGMGTVRRQAIHALRYGEIYLFRFVILIARLGRRNLPYFGANCIIFQRFSRSIDGSCGMYSMLKRLFHTHTHTHWYGMCVLYYIIQ